MLTIATKPLSKPQPALLLSSATASTIPSISCATASYPCLPLQPSPYHSYHSHCQFIPLVLQSPYSSSCHLFILAFPTYLITLASHLPPHLPTNVLPSFPTIISNCSCGLEGGWCGPSCNYKHGYNSCMCPLALSYFCITLHACHTRQ